MCKEHQTTVQGAVQTAAGIAMVTMLEEQEWEVESNVTVNVRPFLKSEVPNDYAGAYCFGLQCKNLAVSSPDANKFWSMAKIASGDLHAKLNQKVHIKMWPTINCLLSVMIQMFGGMAKAKDDRSGRRSGQLLSFTNLGHAKFLNRSPGDEIILRARFGCSAQHQRGTVFANSVATFNGKLIWTVIYYSNIVNDATAKKYADIVKGTILKALNDIND